MPCPSPNERIVHCICSQTASGMAKRTAIALHAEMNAALVRSVFDRDNDFLGVAAGAFAPDDCGKRIYVGTRSPGLRADARNRFDRLRLRLAGAGKFSARAH